MKLSFILSLSVITSVSLQSSAQASQSRIAAGPQHTCAISKSGGLDCWGKFYSGSDWLDRLNIKSPIVDVSAGGKFLSHSTCAVDQDGKLYCFEYDMAGNFELLQNPKGLPAVESASIGPWGVCVILKSNQMVQCWGDVADEGSMPKYLGTVKAVRVSIDHACVLKTGNSIQCWGNNDFQKSQGPSKFWYLESIALGHSSTCTADLTGILRCWGIWGYPMSQMELQGSAELASRPIDWVRVSREIGNVKSVAMSTDFGCAVRKDKGTLVCFGNTPFATRNLDAYGSFDVVVVGNSHICGIKTDGTIVCLGDSKDRKLEGPSFESSEKDAEPSAGFRNQKPASVAQALPVVKPIVSKPFPRIDWIAPTHGELQDRTLITINGANFNERSTVTLGGVACLSVRFENSGKITCLTQPAYSPGKVDLVVTTSTREFGFLQGTQRRAFEFDEPRAASALPRRENAQPAIRPAVERKIPSVQPVFQAPVRPVVQKIVQPAVEPMTQPSFHMGQETRNQIAGVAVAAWKMAKEYKQHLDLGNRVLEVERKQVKIDQRLDDHDVKLDDHSAQLEDHNAQIEDINRLALIQLKKSIEELSKDPHVELYYKNVYSNLFYNLSLYKNLNTKKYERSPGVREKISAGLGAAVGSIPGTYILGTLVEMALSKTVTISRDNRIENVVASFEPDTLDEVSKRVAVSLAKHFSKEIAPLSDKQITEQSLYDAKLVYRSVSKGVIVRANADKIKDEGRSINPEEKANLLKQLVYDHYVTDKFPHVKAPLERFNDWVKDKAS